MKPLDDSDKKKKEEHSKFIEFLQKEVIKIERQSLYVVLRFIKGFPQGFFYFIDGSRIEMAKVWATLKPAT